MGSDPAFSPRASVCWSDRQTRGSRDLSSEKGFRAGIDSVFLAATIPCNPGESVFEAGIGTGVAALCTLARTPGIHLTGVEVAARYALLCEENAKRNGFGGNVRVIHADIKEALRKTVNWYRDNPLESLNL